MISTDTIDTTYATLAETARPALLAFGRKLSHDDATAQDLTQEALEVAFRKFDRFDAKRGTFKSWCNSILLNKWRDRLRAARRCEVTMSSLGEAVEEELASVAHNDVVDAEAQAVSNLNLEIMLSLLDPDERRVAKLLSEGVGEREIMGGYNRENLAAYEAIIASIRVKLAAFDPNRQG